jgi:hypothetical protein
MIESGQGTIGSGTCAGVGAEAGGLTTGFFSSVLQPLRFPEAFRFVFVVVAGIGAVWAVVLFAVAGSSAGQPFAAAIMRAERKGQRSLWTDAE